VGLLTALQALGLGQNQLTSLPAEVGSLTLEQLLLE
jgi:Leucine-rich repeat (LRR) protein